MNFFLIIGPFVVNEFGVLRNISKIESSPAATNSAIRTVQLAMFFGAST